MQMFTIVSTTDWVNVNRRIQHIKTGHPDREIILDHFDEMTAHAIGQLNAKYPTIRGVNPKWIDENTYQFTIERLDADTGEWYADKVRTLQIVEAELKF